MVPCTEKLFGSCGECVACRAKLFKRQESRIARLLKALGFYADEESYSVSVDDSGHTPIEVDHGQIARVGVALDEK